MTSNFVISGSQPLLVTPGIPVIGQTFPRRACWAFQGGRFCGGCRFAHLCFKCGSRVDRFDFLLHGYDRDYKRFLTDGFTFGFRLGFTGDERSLESSNLKSDLSQPQVVSAKLEKERAAGRIAGPFSSPPFPYFRCSPLGIVPKKDPSELRLIHHLSYPKASSVKDYIPQEFSSVKYACINDAISVIKSSGAGCFMAKTDIKSAFRIIPVHPKDHPLLCA